MGRKRDDEIFAGVRSKVAPIPAPVAEQTAPEQEQVTVVQARSPRRPSREGMSFYGFQISEQAKEQLRVLAYETRMEKQELMWEALNMLFVKYGMDPVEHVSARREAGKPQDR